MSNPFPPVPVIIDIVESDSDEIKEIINIESDSDVKNVDLNGSDFFVIDEVGADDKEEGETVDEKDEGETIDKKPIENLFCLDTTPEVGNADKERSLGPRYRREYTATLSIRETSSQEASADSAVKPDNRCFNCLGDHSVANCPKPRDQRAIGRNRKMFMNNQPKQTKRYHLDSNNKFDNIKPGVISQSLRDALGMRRRDVPKFIYQMRIAGYPPGWIEEMKETSSGIDLLDNPSPRRKNSHQFTYDFDKVVDFPGFNVPLDPEYRDDWRYLNYPPMLPNHSKEFFIKQLQHNHFRSSSCPSGNSFSGPPLHYNFHQPNQCYPHHSGPPPPPPEVVDLDATDVEEIDMEIASQDSIEELELKRKALLAELQADDTDEDEGPPGVDDEDPAKDAPSSSSVQAEASVCSTTSSTMVEMGTPVAIRFSSFTSLPGRDKFAQDMSELELYENLPQSTGTFKRMKSLLNKVRTMFKKKK